MTQVKRFWAKVAKSDACWLWTAGRMTGCGWTAFDGKSMLAHRVSWLLAHGALPPRNIKVRHTCANPLCVRPEHLYLDDGNVSMETAAHRFWRCVAKSDGCWNWTGQYNRAGYGQFTVNSKKTYAHRFSYELHTGSQIPPGLYVCHHCDNPKCIHPDHLFVGTQQDNLQDAKAKGRTCTGAKHNSKTHPHIIRRGSKNHFSKLAEDDVIAIRRRLSSGESVQSVSEDYPVGYHAVWFIAKGKSWAHLR